MNASYRLAAPFVALAALTACSGGSSAPVAPIVTNGTSAANGSHASGVPYSAGLLNGATLVGRAQLKTVGFDVLVTMRDPAGLQQYAKNSNDPKNPLYRHWLTPQELGDRFGASPSDYAAATAYLAANGIAYKTYPQRQILRIAGPQANVERAFGVQFGYYRKGAQTFLAPIAAPRPAAALHAAALGNVVRLRLKSRRLLPLRPANSFVDGYSPEQMANAFDYTGAYAAGYKGDGITIGIIGTGAITDGDPRIAGGDVAEYRALFGYGGTGVVKQDVDVSNYSTGNTAGPPGSQYSQSGLATPPPVTSPTIQACLSQGFSLNDPGSYDFITDFTTCNPEDTESQLDTEEASSLAPDATVNFYVAYNPSECYATCSAQNPPAQELGLNESDDEIQQAIADNESDIVSMSFGLDEPDSEFGTPGYFGTPGTNNFGPIEFASLATEGIAVFAASGDNGAEACANTSDAPCVSYPATDPSVISVGGVNLPLDNSGRLTGPMTGWGVQTQISDGAGGSGGGCSAYFQEPSYGSAANLPCAGARVQPDLALDADTNTGVAVVLNAAPSLGGRIVADVGGTSVAAPEMAAMWALVLQACKQTPACVANGSGATPYRLGNPGSYLYPIYENASQYQASFYDVLFGNNALPGTGGGLDPGYTAGQGFDLVTGIGAPFGRNLISSVLAHVP
jgi:subtilase family serine protease